MAKKKATKKKSVKEKVKKLSFVERFRIPKNEEEHLERLLESTKRAITGSGDSIDELFTQQYARIEKELEALRNKK